MDHNCELFTTAKNRHIHFERETCPTLVMLGSNGISVRIFQAHYAKGLVILVDSSLNSTAWIDVAVANSRGMLPFIKCIFKWFPPVFFSIPLKYGLTLNTVCVLGPSTLYVT